MGLIEALTKNRAELNDAATDPELRPVTVGLAPVHAIGWASHVVGELPRWSVRGTYEEKGLVHATHTTRVWRFVDDVHLGFEPHPAGCRIVARSQSRIGKGDLGQNRRNLRMLTRALRQAEAAREERVRSGARQGVAG